MESLMPGLVPLGYESPKQPSTQRVAKTLLECTDICWSQSGEAFSPLKLTPGR